MMLAGGAIVGSNLAVAKAAHSFGDETIRVAVVGCGARGCNAVNEILQANGDVQLVAMADAFANAVHTCYRTIKGKHADQVKVDDRRFVGLDAYQSVIQSDADVVILATPPAFRPAHLEAAVAAGKHVFVESPVATDAPGVQRIIAAGEIAKQKGLQVQFGLQRHYEQRYRDMIQQLQSGIIGTPVFARAYWNGTEPKFRPRTKGQSELDFQLRNWRYFNWLSGDLINEQHVHNLDVINWLVGAHPLEAQGQGGRQSDGESRFGETFDHHMVEYTYPGGLRMLSQCRHMSGCWKNVGEHIHCSNGSADISGGKIYDTAGKLIWKTESKLAAGKGWQSAMDHFVDLLRSGQSADSQSGAGTASDSLVPDGLTQAATSTMTAILGRMATYSGKIVKWNTASRSTLALANIDSLRSLDAAAPVQPAADGGYKTAMPGSNERIV